MADWPPQYECFGGDFYETSDADAKDILQSLAASTTHLQPLCLDLVNGAGVVSSSSPINDQLGGPNGQHHDLLPTYEVGRFNDYIDGKFEHGASGAHADYYYASAGPHGNLVSSWTGHEMQFESSIDISDLMSMSDPGLRSDSSCSSTLTIHRNSPQLGASPTNETHISPTSSSSNSNLCSSTPSSSSRCANLELASDLDSRYWESKPPDQWTSEDVWHWIFSWAGDRSVDVEEVQPLAYSNMTGQQLCQMSRADFVNINPKYGGHIFETLQQLSNQFRSSSLTTPSSNSSDFSFFPNLPSFDLLRSSCLDLDACQGSSPSSNSSESDRESTSSSMTTVNDRSGGLGSNLLSVSTGNSLPSISSVHPMGEQVANHMMKSSLVSPSGLANGQGTLLPVPVKKVGRRGRPPKKDAKSRNRQGKGNGKLWEFIRDLLLNVETNPSFIRWERREDGIFKFVQSDKVAKLWGQRKQNPRMTYEKLSRAMRYYYKSQVLLPVFGRRLVYKFGPNATGWRPHQVAPGNTLG